MAESGVPTYANLADVEARNTLRLKRGGFSATSSPTATQVTAYLADTAVTLDAILRGRGYNLPIPQYAISALRWLRQANAAGAHARIENAASEQDSLDESAEAAWKSACDMLRKGEIELDVPRDVTTTHSRSNRRTQGPRLFSLEQEL